MTDIPRNIARKLRSAVGERYDDSIETRTTYSYDAGRTSSLPGAVVWPRSTEEVSQILKLADENKIPIVGRGAGSSLVGATVPIRGGIVVSFEQLNRIIEIDHTDAIAIVEPGVVTEHLHREVEKRGLFYPPDPASRAFCTIGGNVMTGAGGLRAIKYGVTRDYVLGLQAVLAGGKVIDIGTRTHKGVVGYDLARLLVGSEGTLALVTRIVLKLIGKPQSKITLVAFFDDIGSAVKASNLILERGFMPAALELVDNSALRALRLADKAPVGLDPRAGAMLLVEDDGGRQELELRAPAIKKTIEECSPIILQLADNEKDSDQLWAARRAISAALYQIRPDKLNEDVTVGRSQLATLFERARVIAEDAKIECALFGHSGDGNVHVNYLFDRSDPDEAERAQKAVRLLMEEVIELGGTLSGEHGVGTAKQPYFSMEIGSSETQLMREIKKVFDPNGILNPGKIFPA